MSYIRLHDGTEMFYKDWGKGQPILFSHGWPLNADAWDAQMLFFGEQGFRVIAHDRRSHGRSSQSWNGNNMDTYADDLAALIAELDLVNVVLVGHSTGGGEVTRFLGRYGSRRVSKAALIAAVPPVMLQSNSNPDGLPKAAFDAIRTGVQQNRSEYFKELSLAFYGYNLPGAKASEGVRDAFWLQGMMGGIKGEYDCVQAFSETDFTSDLKGIDVPVLLLHGDADQIVPLKDASLLTARLVKESTLKVYPGLPHGMCQTHADVINHDLLAFIRA